MAAATAAGGAGAGRAEGSKTEGWSAPRPRVPALAASGLALLVVAGSHGPWAVAYHAEPTFWHFSTDNTATMVCGLLALAYLAPAAARIFRRRWADFAAALLLALAGGTATIDWVWTTRDWTERYADPVLDPAWGIAAVAAGGFGGAVLLLGLAAGLGQPRRGEPTAPTDRAGIGWSAGLVGLLPWASSAAVVAGALAPWTVDRVERVRWSLEARVTGAALPEGRWALALGVAALVLLAWGTVPRATTGWRMAAAACLAAAAAAAGWAWATLDGPTPYTFYPGHEATPGWGLVLALAAGLAGAAGVAATLLGRQRAERGDTVQHG